MTKKLSFDKLPEALEKFFETLTADDSERTWLPELFGRLALLEKKIDHLQRTLSPDKPVMDMTEVCRVLKLRPKAVNELAMSGALPSCKQGNKTLFYEEDVAKYFMTRGSYRKEGSQSDSAEPGFPQDVPVGKYSAELATRVGQRVNIHAASEIIGRNPPAIYQLITTKGIPYYKDGRTVYFLADELQEWLKTNPPRKHRKRSLV